MGLARFFIQLEIEVDVAAINTEKIEIVPLVPEVVPALHIELFHVVVGRIEVTNEHDEEKGCLSGVVPLNVDLVDIETEGQDVDCVDEATEVVEVSGVCAPFVVE